MRVIPYTGHPYITSVVINQCCRDFLIALSTTGSEGFPVAYEVIPGNTSDKTTLPGFLRKIEEQYGKMNRLWIIDRGIPTEDALEQMRDQGASYLVGTPRKRVSKLEDKLYTLPWRKVQIQVKLARDGEDLYVLTRSNGRRDKEQSRRRLKKLWRRLHEIRAMKNLKRDALLLKLGAAKQAAGSDHGWPQARSAPLYPAGNELQLLMHQLNLNLPEQPPPRLEELAEKCGADL